LIAAGFVARSSGHLGFAMKRDVRGVWLTYRGWLLMTPAVFLALYFGRITTICGIALLAIGGFKEYSRATGSTATGGTRAPSTSALPPSRP